MDLKFVRCANTLPAGHGCPMFATHAPRAIAILADRAASYGRVRPDEQRGLSELVSRS